MLKVEHSAILATFIKLPVVINIFILSIFEWPFYRTEQMVYLKIPVGNKAHEDITQVFTVLLKERAFPAGISIYDIQRQRKVRRGVS